MRRSILVILSLAAAAVLSSLALHLRAVLPADARNLNSTSPTVTVTVK